jgi:hypothetical protein
MSGNLSFLNTAGYRVNNTNVIDSSRNLTNIGTISSGAITSTGAISAEDNIYLTDAGTVRGKLLLNASDRDNVELRAESLGSTMKFFTVGTQALLLNSSQNATFAGTISSGAITSSGDVTAFSDERLKSNIQTLDGKKALQMRGVSFEKDGIQNSGVIAQEIEKIAPELVHTSDDEIKTKSVAYGNLVGYLIEAVKEQQEQINKLTDRINDLAKGE